MCMEMIHVFMVYNKYTIIKYNKVIFTQQNLFYYNVFIVQHEYFEHFSLACIFRSSVDRFNQETKTSSGRCVACEMKVWTAVIQRTEI